MPVCVQVRACHKTGHTQHLWHLQCVPAIAETVPSSCSRSRCVQDGALDADDLDSLQEFHNLPGKAQTAAATTLREDTTSDDSCGGGGSAGPSTKNPAGGGEGMGSKPNPDAGQSFGSSKRPMQQQRCFSKHVTRHSTESCVVGRGLVVTDEQHGKRTADKHHMHAIATYSLYRGMMHLKEPAGFRDAATKYIWPSGCCTWATYNLCDTDASTPEHCIPDVLMVTVACESPLTTFTRCRQADPVLSVCFCDQSNLRRYDTGETFQSAEASANGVC